MFGYLLSLSELLWSLHPLLLNSFSPLLHLNSTLFWVTFCLYLQTLTFNFFFLSHFSATTGSTTPNRTKENDVSLLLEMVEWFCKQVQKALKKRFLHMHFAKGSLRKLNPFVLFRAKYSFYFEFLLVLLCIYKHPFIPLSFPNKLYYNPGNGLELKILCGRITPLQKMRKLNNIGGVQRLFCKFHHKKVSWALTKHSITILNERILTMVMSGSQSSVF